MRSIALLSLLALASCAPSPVTPATHTPQGAVPKSRNAADAAATVRSAASALNLNASRVEARAGTISREAGSLREALSSATAEANRMRKVDAATKEEMAQLWAKLTEITRHSAMLEDQAREAVGDLDEQRVLRAEADARIAEMEMAARDKDLEATLLRTQYEDEQAVAKSQSDLAIENGKAAVIWRSKHDEVKGRVDLYDLIAIIIGIVILIFVAIRWGWPLFRTSVLGR